VAELEDTLCRTPPRPPPKFEEWLLEHDFRSVIEKCVSQVVLSQGDNPCKEIAELFLSYAPQEPSTTAETQPADC